ncbi:hypothetical protein D0T49_06435 [Paludibacter sp. 221]|uniref:DUF6048 family protein n=1 Tax=Paludibacter sp. 221 TaxID=2302939 RepID=UPI0013CFA1F6|nr:DUF6048 family protein [Paludibacter sp. 221]NDV46681.1 hypothetical protein [Paludibacter sp. 221]
MSKTLRYIILLSSFVGSISFQAFSQAGKTETEEKIPLYQGVKAELDLASIVMSAISNGETYSVEANVQVNLREKYFPVLEMGFAGANKISHNDYGFKTNGIFARIGIDYNLMKPNAPDASIRKYFFLGGRYAFSPFSYDVTNVIVEDDYWGGEAVRDFLGMKTTKHWLEVVAGLKVEVFQNIYMGWNVRIKILLGQEKLGEISPWYIPGVGIKSTGANWGFNYTIGYKF